jgi:hypothetical protein
MNQCIANKCARQIGGMHRHRRVSESAAALLFLRGSGDQKRRSADADIGRAAFSAGVIGVRRR